MIELSNEKRTKFCSWPDRKFNKWARDWLDCQKRGQAQSLSSRAVAKILNILNKQNYVADATLSTRKWDLLKTFKLLYRLMPTWSLLYRLTNTKKVDCHKH